MDSNEPIVTPPDLLTALETLEREMRETSRVKTHDLGRPDAVLEWKVDDWADQLAALRARYAEPEQD